MLYAYNPPYTAIIRMDWMLQYVIDLITVVAVGIIVNEQYGGINTQTQTHIETREHKY
jgi:hypothetical protein